MSEIVILSDDLTGACDSAACFARYTGEADVFIDSTCFVENLMEYNTRVIAVNTATRTIHKTDAYEKVLHTAESIPIFADRTLVKKIDAAYRGHVGTELKAMMRGFHRRICFIINAIPDMGRITVDGFQYINGVPLGKTEYSQDPVNGPKDSYIPNLLKAEGGVDADVITRDILNSEDLYPFIQDRTSRGIDTFIIDAETNEDVITAYRLLSERFDNSIFAGSLGLMKAIAKTLGQGNPDPKKDSLPSRKTAGFSASAYEMTKTQIKTAEERGFIKGFYFMIEDSLQAYQRKIESIVDADNIFILCGSREKDSGNLQKSENILSLLKKTAQSLSLDKYQRLIFCGGESSYDILRFFGASRIKISRLLEDAIAAGTILDGVLAGKEICIKGGSVGSSDAVIHMITQ